LTLNILKVTVSGVETIPASTKSAAAVANHGREQIPATTVSRGSNGTYSRLPDFGFILAR
jgi:hypothetical protein